jgi:RNA polymerase sigma factor (sigma-70 family)
MTDSELWQAVLDGDGKAWEKLVHRYKALVYAVSVRAGLSMADAADCFQQTWVITYQNRRKIKEPARLSAWLVTTAKREAIRLIRKAAQSDNLPPDVASPCEQILPDEELEQLEKQAHLEIALKEIDDRCRGVLRAFFFSPEDKSYEEIAGALAISPNSLGALRRRCLERLKQILIKNKYLAERKDD